MSYQAYNLSAFHRDAISRNQTLFVHTANGSLMVPRDVIFDSASGCPTERGYIDYSEITGHEAIDNNPESRNDSEDDDFNLGRMFFATPSDRQDSISERESLTKQIERGNR